MFFLVLKISLRKHRGKGKTRTDKPRSHALRPVERDLFVAPCFCGQSRGRALKKMFGFLTNTNRSGQQKPQKISLVIGLQAYNLFWENPQLSGWRFGVSYYPVETFDNSQFFMAFRQEYGFTQKLQLSFSFWTFYVGVSSPWNCYHQKGYPNGKIQGCLRVLAETRKNDPCFCRRVFCDNCQKSLLLVWKHRIVISWQEVGMNNATQPKRTHSVVQRGLKQKAGIAKNNLEAAASFFNWLSSDKQCTFACNSNTSFEFPCLCWCMKDRIT